MSDQPTTTAQLLAYEILKKLVAGAQHAEMSDAQWPSLGRRFSVEVLEVELTAEEADLVTRLAMG